MGPTCLLDFAVHGLIPSSLLTFSAKVKLPTSIASDQTALADRKSLHREWNWK
jgi:hypothetical protein